MGRDTTGKVSYITSLFNFYRMQPTERFSNRVNHYVRYRPGYPDSLLQFLHTTFGLSAATPVADIGSGTGIFTQLLLEKGYPVFAVEPNACMRSAAETALLGYPNFTSVNGTGEDTGLPAQSMSLVVAAQSFHWLDAEKARQEFSRILRPGGYLALLWNIRQLETPFARGYEALLQQFGKDYTAIRKTHELVLQPFFALQGMQARMFPHNQRLNLEQLKGLVQSASYMPLKGQRGFQALCWEIEALFHKYERNGLVQVDYEAKVYFNA